jgi:hypothetical protein
MHHELDQIDFQKTGLVGGDYNPEGRLYDEGSYVHTSKVFDTVQDIDETQSFNEYYKEYHKEDRTVKHNK